MNVHDMELALKRAAGRSELAAELHQMLLISCVEHKDLIERSWISGDRDELLAHVHKLNGSTRYCGVPELEHCAEELESQLKRGMDNVESGYQALISALNNLQQHKVAF